jgi:YceI-like domain
MRRRHIVALVAPALFLAACGELLRVQATVASPAEFPERYYLQAHQQGRPVYRVDPAESLVVIEVRRGGSLARLGHDHVVASRNLTGYVAPGEGRADMFVALASLVVDEAQLRQEAGFDTQPSESDIDATRSNMLRHVLEVERFPFALIAVSGAVATQKKATLSVSITLHGQTRTLWVPAEIEADEQNIRVAARLALNQTDFAITPYSLLGGAIAVKDALELRFRISARRIAD